MADSTEGDTMVLYLDLLALALITLIAGLVIHSFIIGVNINDWRKGRSVTPIDQVVTALGISRMCAQCVVIPYLYVVLLLQKSLGFNLTSYLIVNCMDLLCCFFLYANIWLTSLLSIVFCLKISSLRTRLFLYLRRMIEQRTVYFIVIAVIFSMFNCLSLFLATVSDIMVGGNSNTTMVNPLLNCSSNNYVYNFTLGAFIPLLFGCISSVILFGSLYHHTRRMKMSGNLSVNLETYYSAMKFISFTFICNIIYYTGYFVNIIYFYFYCVELLWVYIFLECLPALHSSYLIYRTAKLRSQMVKVLQNVTGFLFAWKDPETRENIELAGQ